MPGFHITRDDPNGPHQLAYITNGNYHDPKGFVLFMGDFASFDEAWEEAARYKRMSKGIDLANGISFSCEPARARSLLDVAPWHDTSLRLAPLSAE